MASQPGCIHFKSDTVQHTYQSLIPVPQHYKTAIKNNLHVDALDQKDPKKNVKQVPLTTGTFQAIVEILELSSTRTSFSFAKKIFFLSKLCTHDYYQTFTIHELKQKEKYIEKT